MRLRQRSTVVFPHPDGPMKAVISCSWIVKDTPLTAWCAPYHTETSDNEKTGRAAWATGGRVIAPIEITVLSTVCIPFMVGSSSRGSPRHEAGGDRPREHG